MTGVANGLVIHLPGLARQRFGECAQPARSIESLVLDPIQRKGFQPFQRRHRGAHAIHNGFTGVAIFVDQPLGAPRQVVAQGSLRVARQGTHAHAQCVQRVKARSQILPHDADEPRGQPALGHQHTLRRTTRPALYRQAADGVGALHVFRQVKVMHACLHAQRGHRHRAVVWQGVQDSKPALHRR